MLTRKFPRRLVPFACRLAAAWAIFSVSTSPLCSAASRPNIVVIMVDDMGFSDLGCYGGEIETPRIDALAESGLRFGQFYNAGRCCPTRASLLTGLYPHKVGLGYMTSQDYGRPGYRADLSGDCETLAESLKKLEYHTYMVGKWHVCHDFAADGPRHNWPRQRGFDRFFGTLIAAGSLWNPPTLRDGNQPIEPQGDFYYTEALTDKAIEYIEQTDDDQPFFLYVAHPAPHWPLHARNNVIARYRGRFAAGWDELRKQRTRRLGELGLINPDWPLSRRDERCVPWESLTSEQQVWQQSRMEAFAAMLDQVDHSVGRIVDAISARGELDNTLIMFLSDNGGESLEHPNGEIGDTGTPWAVMRYVPLWTRDGRPVVAGDLPGVRPGPENTFAGYGANWANLSNTPFRRFKTFVHEGGIATPLIVHWPRGVAVAGTVSQVPAHVVDIKATCLAVAGGTPAPDRQDGVSLLPLFAGGQLSSRSLFWEHQGNRAVRRDRWKLVAQYPHPWELYDMNEDRTETEDLAEQHPKVVGELAASYDRWAAHCDVLPWDTLAIHEIASKDSPLRRSDAELSEYFAALREPGNVSSERPNVLFIALDDLNDWVGFLGGHPDAHTPHMDRLAKRGVMFTNAFCVSPICGPSRASVLTGMRPETTGVYHNVGTYRDYRPQSVTFPEHFRAHGYATLAAGKINHDLGAPDPLLWDENGPDCGLLGTPFVDDELNTLPLGQTRLIQRGNLRITLPANGGLSAIDRRTMTWNSFDWAPLDVSDDEFPDARIAAWGTQQLARRRTEPFFLAIGFYKPHQPFFAPRKYFELYNGKQVALPPTIAGDLYDIPPPGRSLARRPWTSGTHRTVVAQRAWREAVHAYLATVSFADAQVGRLIDALDQSRHAENTWIVLWSDHGWSLGSKEHWGKHAPWRENVRVPLIIVPPLQAAPTGFQPDTRCNVPVSLLDLYPTLLAMCDLPSRPELEGDDLLPLVADPTGAGVESANGKSIVTTMGRGTHGVVTQRWHYVRYFDGSEELYDREADPQEWFNLAGESGYGAVIDRLARNLPVDNRIRQFVRHGRYKCVIPASGAPLLFDFNAVFGISEQFDVAAEHKDVVGSIQAYVREHQVTDRHVLMPRNRVARAADAP
jgi:arylsulfatase